VGIGIVSFVETTGVGPYEGARVTVETDGRVSVATGVGTQGQGHFTSFAQIVADQLGVSPRDVRLVTGDTAEFHWGTGTFASRGAVVAANAIHAAALSVRKKILRQASKALDTPEEELELADGRCAWPTCPTGPSASASWPCRPTPCAAPSSRAPSPGSSPPTTLARNTAPRPTAPTP
jgi:aerobic carbon-monoxide dehydrogenase large subunit